MAVSSTESVMHLKEIVRKTVQVNDVSEIFLQPPQDAVSEQLAVGDATRERATSQVGADIEAAREKAAQGPGDDSSDAMRRLQLVIR